MQDNPNPELSKSQQAAFDDACDNKSLFITGAGGVGKSFLIHKIKKQLEEQGRQVALTSSTGISAVNIGGNTIHSFLGLGASANVSALSKISKKQVGMTRNYIGRYDTVIVDEVSMLTGDYIEMMNSWFKRIYANSAPFGGRQMLFMGDFLQLPPVITEDDYVTDKYAFQSENWNLIVKEHYLTKSFRQDNKKLKYFLDCIRFGKVTDEVLDYFNSRVRIDLKDGEPVRLYPHKNTAHKINYQELDALDGKEYEYEATFTGDDKWQQSIAKSVIAEVALYIKVGAPVLFIKNNPAEGYYNGMKGTVVECTDYNIVVETLDGQTIRVEPADWERCDTDGKVLATMTQMPLILGWAITIHKSQGMTLDYMSCDLSNCFEYGQAYVALSRIRTLEGLSIDKPITKRDIKADKIIIDYYRKLITAKRKLKNLA